MGIDYPSQLKLLRELQDIDLKLHRDRTALAAIPTEKEALEAEHRLARAEYDALKAELAEVEHQRRTDEGDLNASVAHLEEREKKLYAIKTNKEYQAAVKEISEAKRQNREREERILQSMEKIEELNQKTAQLESDIADKNAAYEKRLAELDARMAEHEKEIEAFEARRPELLDGIDTALMRKYDHVRRRYPDALVPILKGVCSGCSMNVPPQLNIEVMKGLEFKNCPSCHRLIFVPSEEEVAKAAASAEEQVEQ